MSCTTIKRNFSVRFDDRLGSAARRRFDEHLSACSDCRREYEHYERLFMAVRSVPSSHMSRPLPVPESSRAFTAAAARRPAWRSWVSAACVVALLAGVGAAAFQVGRSSGIGGPAEIASRDGEAVDASAADLPSPQAGKLVSRLHRGASTMGALFNVAAESPGEGTCREMGLAVRRIPMQEDVQRLNRMDAGRLGRYAADVHGFCDNLGSFLGEARSKLERPVDAAAVLAGLRRRLVDGEFQRYLDRLRPVAERFEPEPYRVEAASEGSPGGVFVIGLKFAIEGNDDRAFEAFGRVVERDRNGFFGKAAHFFRSHHLRRLLRHVPFEVEIEEDMLDLGAEKLMSPFMKSPRLRLHEEDGHVLIIELKSEDGLEIRRHRIKRKGGLVRFPKKL